MSLMVRFLISVRDWIQWWFAEFSPWIRWAMFDVVLAIIARLAIKRFASLKGFFEFIGIL